MKSEARRKKRKRKSKVVHHIVDQSYAEKEYDTMHVVAEMLENKRFFYDKEHERYVS